MPTKVDRCSVDPSAFPDLMVKYVGMRVPPSQASRRRSASDLTARSPRRSRSSHALRARDIYWVGGGVRPQAKGRAMQGGLRLMIEATVVITFGCSHGHGPPADPGQLRPNAAPILVNVTNNSQSAMEIYAAGGGTSYRIGTVAPGIARRFELRPGMIASGGQVHFVAQATGAGPRVQSEQLTLSPGDIVDFEITTNLVGSRTTVRP
jgi:hypothetical protein